MRALSSGKPVTYPLQKICRGLVPATLHTPLMSGSNAISGIIIVGALLVTGSELGGLNSTLGFLAVVLAMINVMGGFLVTDRMLQMFKKKKE